MSTLFSAFIFLSTLTSFMDNNFFLLWLFFFFTCLQLGVLFLSKQNENLAAAYIVVPFKSTGRFPETIYHQQIMCKTLSEKKCHLHTHTRVLIFHFAYNSNHVIYHFFKNCRKISCYLRHTLQTVMSTLKFKLTLLNRCKVSGNVEFSIVQKYRYLHENT